MTQVSRSTPNGATVQRYMIHVERGGAALALQTGLLDRRKRLVRGLPADIISGNIAQVKAAWRGAFLAHGALSDPGKAGFLEIICRRTRPPSRFGRRTQARHHGEAPTAAQFGAYHAQGPDAIERMLILMGARTQQGSGQASAPTARHGARRTVWRTSTTPTCAAARRPLPKPARKCAAHSRFSRRHPRKPSCRGPAAP